MFKWAILSLLSLLTAGALSLGIHLGVMKPVSVQLEEAGPFKTVSKHHVGAYHKIVPVIESVEKWARENGEKCEKSFGEYLDNPRTVDEDRLQSNGGCFVEKEWNQGLPPELSFGERPRRLYVVARFDGAPSIGPYKVYPKAQEWIDQNGYTVKGPIIEVYQILSATAVHTEYLFPVEKK